MREGRRLEPKGSRPMRLGHVSNAAINQRSMLSFTKTSSLLKLLFDELKNVHDGSR
jgi:hypothetical protein